MKKNLRFKFRVLLFSLITLNALMIIFSLFNLFSIKKSVNNFMNYNFDSINAANNMIEYSEKQNIALINYIFTNDESYKNEFFDLKESFIENYKLQVSKTTEVGEVELTEKIDDAYNTYISECINLFNDSDTKIVDGKFKDYYDKIQINYANLKDQLKNLYNINEKAMNSKIAYSEKNINFSINFLFFIFSLTFIFSLFTSNKYLNKLLSPIASLHKSVKSFKDGNFSFDSDVYSEDEVGVLYKEFKEMSEKIIEFKNSTLGQLIEEKNKSLAIVKSISNPLIVLDSDFRCVLINNSFENYFKVMESSIIGQHMLKFIPNEDLFNFILGVKEEKITSKSKIMCFSKEQYVFNISVSTITNVDSLFNGIIIYFQDITRIKKLEHLKDDFISTLSHELKTPLTSIMMGASMLEEDVILKNKQESEKIIETLQEDSQKLLDMIDNMLRLTELENEQNYLNLEPTDLSEIINSSIKSFMTIAFSKNINVFFEKEKNIPLIFIDKEKFLWVINNLLSNAIKYSFQGGDIYITLKYNKKALVLTFKDSGMGINQEDIPRIFDKFYRGNDFSNGTGLGLPLSKQIIELHNGTIVCESKLGEGSIFKVSIPKSGGIYEKNFSCR